MNRTDTRPTTDHLPRPGGPILLTDAGLETVLVFHEGRDLPAFAAFPLLDEPDGRTWLDGYYLEFMATAGALGHGFVLETPTWRANPRWGPKLGYDDEQLWRVNVDAVAHLRRLAERWTSDAPLLVSGCIGPRDDGYQPSEHDGADAYATHHRLQIDAFAHAGVDLTTALTIGTVAEATGVTVAAARAGVAVAVSFTVETDGRLPDGTPLHEAIEATDAATGAYPTCYLVNCAHPEHLADGLGAAGAWRERIMGLRANASTKSHAELDEATELDDGDPYELARGYLELRAHLPNLQVVGGCCGTDHRHVAAVAEAFAA